MIDDFEIVPMVIPATIDSDDAAGFLALIEVGNACTRAEAGHDYLDEHAAEVLPDWLDQTDRSRAAFLALQAGAVVAAVVIELVNEPGATSADFYLCVPAALWQTGIGDTLTEVAEREVLARGRTTLQCWSLHRPDSTDELLRPPTGFGGIPRHDEQTQVLLRRGFSLEQVERNSVFDLTGSFDVVDRLLEEGLAKAGPDYRVVSWSTPTPPEYREGYAAVLSRMATDPPSGQLVFEEETWDAARVERRDARMLAGGHTTSVAGVIHEPSGQMVAYNELVIGEDLSGPTHQYGTLVLTEHRGHRLGAIVKGANLCRWRELVPTSPRVSTFNAEENRHMLSINEELGFVPASYAGAWKKVLVG